MHRRIDNFRRLLLLPVCIAASISGAFAQHTPSGVTLRPVDTGRSVVTFNLGGSGNDAGRYAIKTNLLYAAAAQSPNLAFEYALGRRASVEATVGYNNWGNLWDNSATGPDYDPTNSYKRRLDHFFAKAEYRHWFRRPFEGRFMGGGLFYARYNAGEMAIPTIFEKGFDYYGDAFGGTVSYGYLWRWGRHWAAEFDLGIGVAVLVYDKSSIRADAATGGYALVDPFRYRKIYFGPTQAGVKLVYVIH